MSWRAAAKRRRCARSAAAEGAGMSRGTPTFSESVCTAARDESAAVNEVTVSRIGKGSAGAKRNN
eukprot:5594535-Pyramimonas_sp.AAC.2